MLRIAHTSDCHWEAEKIDKCIASSPNFIVSKLTELQARSSILFPEITGTGNNHSARQRVSYTVLNTP